MVAQGRGRVLLLLIVSAIFAFSFCRIYFPMEVGPAFSVGKRDVVWVLLEGDFPERGVHQFPDGTRLKSVIQMTVPELAPFIAGSDPLLLSGQALELTRNPLDLRILWMPAGQRIALGIPLHPDRMGREDWLVLPGIGEQLAARIEKNRQQNGDFGSFRSLKRVRGIGEVRIKDWQKFFSPRLSR